MSLHRTKAAIIGLLEANRVNEWVVTEKLGNLMKQKNAKASKKSRSQIGERYLFYFCFLYFSILQGSFPATKMTGRPVNLWNLALS